MSKKLIDLHKEWMEVGEIPENEDGDGLCALIPFEFRDDFNLFKPKNYFELSFPKTYWAHSARPPRDSRAWKEYTTLRQTIVLLICAMNNEL